MKKNLFYLFITAASLFATAGNAQNIAINEDGSAPNPNAILDVKSLTKGVLIPRVSTAGRLLIPNTKGLLVYDTTVNTFWYNTGTNWQNIAASGAGWLLTGNSGTTDSNFIGTTDNRPLIVKVNNIDAGRIDMATSNSFWGSQAGSGATGQFNTAIGSLALRTNTTGSLNTVIGAGAMRGNIAGSGNTANGINALGSSAPGDYNTASGIQAMDLHTFGTNNTAYGAFSMLIGGGSSNTATGAYSLFNGSGNYNTATGYGSMYLAQWGGANTATGYYSLYSNATGATNTAMGTYSLYSVTTGSSNTGIGAYTDIGGSGLLSNATAIGFNAFVNHSNKVRIGNSVVTAIEGAVPYTTVSDGRFKDQVQEDVKGLDFILRLRPVTYNFDVKRFDEQQRDGKRNDSTRAPVDNAMKTAYAEATAIRRTGFIAQEVEKAAIASNYDFSGIIKPKDEKDHYSLSYESFVPSLVKSVQDLNKKLEALEKENASLRNEVNQLKQRSK